MNYREFTMGVDNILQGLKELNIKFNCYSCNCTTIKVIFYDKRQQKKINKHEDKIVELLRKESNFVENSFYNTQLMLYMKI